MGEVFRRPSLIAIEIAWRWLFGIPFLLVCWQQAQQILAAFPLESSGFNSIDTQNPWVAAVQLANVVFVLRTARAGRAALAAAGCRAGVGGGFGPGPQSPAAAHGSLALPFRPIAMIASAGRLAGSAGFCALGLVRSHAVGRGYAHRGGRRAGPGRLFHLGDLSFAGILHGLRADQLGTVDRAASGAARRAALRAFSSWTESAAGKAVHQQAGRDQPGPGHRQAGADCAGDGLFRRAVAVQRRAGWSAHALRVGRFAVFFSLPTTTFRWCGSRRSWSFGGYFGTGRRRRNQFAEPWSANHF